MPETTATTTPSTPSAVLPTGWDRPSWTVLLTPLVTFLAVLGAWVTPKLTADPFLLSFVPTVLVLLLASMHVWMLLRVDLLSFASPVFMAIGGYTLALIAMHRTSNAIVLIVACFLVPAVVALLLGLVLLRLRGTYFALVTFVLAQVIVLVIIIAKGPLGGSSGISGIPPAHLGSTQYGAAGNLVRYSVYVAAVGVLIAGIVSVRWRRHFAAIEENEPLAASLGLRPWLSKTVAFVSAAGVAGLAGLILINQLGNAHPDSFQPFSGVNHVASAVIGGPSILGPVLGALLLAWLTHMFASHAQYSQLLLGLALILVTLFARRGVTGLVQDLTQRARRLAGGAKPTASTTAPAAERRPTRLHASSQDNEAVAPLAERIEPGSEVILEVSGLAKRFGGVAAVDGISFELSPGEVLGVIGPNGAGKTTLINMISGAMQPSDGRVSLRGTKLTGRSSCAMARSGVARSYQQTSVFSGVTVRENLARGKAFSKQWIGDQELAELLALAGLSERLGDRAGDMPYGLQKLLGLVLPLATDPRVMLLDEPAAGLELSERGRVDELIEWAVRRGAAVLIVEHDMDLIRRVCPRLLVMDTGRELAAGTPHDVLARPEVVTAYLGVTDEDEVADVLDTSEAAAGDLPGTAHPTIEVSSHE